jgi:hypothetical protein
MMIAPIYDPTIAKWSKLVATSAESESSAMIRSLREVGLSLLTKICTPQRC